MAKKNTTPKINTDFYGTGWKFPPSFNEISGETITVKDDQDIKESLDILMGTRRGERVMNPYYGTDLFGEVFSAVDVSDQTQIKSIIKDAILNYEPRITLNLVDVDISQIIDGILNISIDYTVNKTNSRNNVVYPFYLAEGTIVAPTLVGGTNS